MINKDTKAYDYDDTTVSESVANCTLLLLYICVMGGSIIQWTRRRKWLKMHKTSRWFGQYDWTISSCICFALFARCTYFADSIAWLISGTHWISPIVYSGLSIISYIGTSLSVLLLCRMWLSYADRARDSSLNKPLKRSLQVAGAAQGPLLCVLLGLAAFERVGSLLWTLVGASSVCVVLAVASKVALTHSLTEYENGRFLARVSITVRMVSGSCCLRVTFYLVRRFFSQQLDELRKEKEFFGVSGNIYYAVVLFFVIILTELLTLTLCSMNLKQVYNTALTSTPSPALKFRNVRTLLCQDERPDNRPLFNSIKGISPKAGSESLLESDSVVSQ